MNSLPQQQARASAQTQQSQYRTNPPTTQPAPRQPVLTASDPTAQKQNYIKSLQAMTPQQLAGMGLSNQQIAQLRAMPSDSPIPGPSTRPNPSNYNQQPLQANIVSPACQKKRHDMALTVPQQQRLPDSSFDRGPAQPPTAKEKLSEATKVVIAMHQALTNNRREHCGR